MGKVIESDSDNSSDSYLETEFEDLEIGDLVNLHKSSNTQNEQICSFNLDNMPFSIDLVDDINCLPYVRMERNIKNCYVIYKNSLNNKIYAYRLTKDNLESIYKLNHRNNDFTDAYDFLFKNNDSDEF